MAKFQGKLKLLIPIVFGIFIICMFCRVDLAFAQQNSDITLYLDEAAIQKGYTLEKPDGLMKLAINPYVLDIPAEVSLKSMTAEGLVMPDDLTRVSDIMEYDILTDPIKIFAKDLVIVLKYNSDNLKTKKIYFYDSINHKWRPLYSETNVIEKYVRAFAHLPYSKIAVFENNESYEGYASWYRSSRYPFGCASNDYPYDTKLRVINLENKKSVICQVKSTGPFVTHRIIDLSSTAFKAIAPTGQGVSRVHVEAVEASAVLAAVKESSASPQVQGLAAPVIKATVALIYDPEKGQVIFEKNSYMKRNIASLTKLMTAIVFIETYPDMNKVVTIEDSDLPKPESGVRLAVNTGDLITVQDLFHGMITGSANNASLALVRSTGMTREEFVQKMNDKTKKLNMMNTVFVDPSGLEVGNISTATDVAILINYLMKRPTVIQASIQPTYTYTIINTNEKRTIKNPLYLYTNILANEPIMAAKTGYINEAGYCLAAKVKQSDGRIFVIMVLGSPTVYSRATDTKNLIEYGLKVF